MMIQWSNIMMEFSDSIDQYRETLKSISIKEFALQPSRDQKRKLKEKIEQLQSSLSSMDKVQSLQEQLQQLEEFTQHDEVEMANFKRIATREALYILLNGMHAMASKSDIISTFGKYIVDELNVEPIQVGEERPRYHAAEKTKRIADDAKKTIEQWNPDRTKVRRTLTSHHGHNPLIIKQLPPVPANSTSNASNKNSSKSPSASNGHSRTPSPTTSSGSVKSIDKIVVPPRNVSLEEQHKQFSFYKPDDTVVSDEEPAAQPIKSPVQQQGPPLMSPSNSSTTHASNDGGFSNMYLNNRLHYLQPGLNQQNLYQFYQNYLPPRSYEDMTSTFSPGAVFHGDGENRTKKHDAGGFVLPSTNPNFVVKPDPTTSSHSLSSAKSNSDTAE
jgi:hypothetical protein